jgi:hypothetical protein
VAERLIAPVLKTGRPKGLVSSNLTPSASIVKNPIEAISIIVLHNKYTKIRRCSPTYSEAAEKCSRRPLRK